MLPTGLYHVSTWEHENVNMFASKNYKKRWPCSLVDMLFDVAPAPDKNSRYVTTAAASPVSDTGDPQRSSWLAHYI